ncbi:MAG: hypothetical protein AABX01_06900, partial [Candidatus Micrarchaeota archaeon]
MGDGSSEGIGEIVGVGIGEGAFVAEGVGIGEGESDGDGEKVGVGAGEGSFVGDGLKVGVGAGDGASVGDGEIVGVGIGEGPWLGLGETLGEGDVSGEGEMFGEGKKEGSGIAEGNSLGETSTVGRLEGETDMARVGSRDAPNEGKIEMLGNREGIIEGKSKAGRGISGVGEKLGEGIGIGVAPVGSRSNGPAAKRGIGAKMPATPCKRTDNRDIVNRAITGNGANWPLCFLSLPGPSSPRGAFSLCGKASLRIEMCPLAPPSLPLNSVRSSAPCPDCFSAFLICLKIRFPRSSG